jgi:hypothetical protein
MVASLVGVLVSVVPVFVHRHGAFLFPSERFVVALAALHGRLDGELWRPRPSRKILWELFEGVSFKIGSSQPLLKVP